MSHSIALIIESLVSALLAFTLIYCNILNKRLKRLKADEQSLKATISELITATGIAERAIAGLKVTVRECDQNLGERLRMAERFSSEISQQLETGQTIIDRLTKIAVAARPEAKHLQSDPKNMVAAAQAFAERARLRVNGRAA